MRYTRKSFNETSGWFNQLPLTPLDETLRFPIAIDEILKELKKEYNIHLDKNAFVIRKGYLYHFSYSKMLVKVLLQPWGPFSFLQRYFKETQVAVGEWDKRIESYEKRISRFKKKKIGELSDRDLYEYIKESIRVDARWLFRIGFGMHVIYSYSLEVILGVLYRILVRDKYYRNYHELLIGFPSKWKEADQAFWKVVKDKLNVDEYIKRYTLRTNDATLAVPMIGEDSNELLTRVKAFKKVEIPDFASKEKEVVQKREKREQYVEENFRTWIPFGRKLFNKVLEIVRVYAPLRESRRFYYTKGSFYVRKSLLGMGKRLDTLSDPNDIFFLRKNELEDIMVGGKKPDKSLQGDISSRKKVWKDGQKSEPPQEINV